MGLHALRDCNVPRCFRLRAFGNASDCSLQCQTKISSVPFCAFSFAFPTLPTLKNDQIDSSVKPAILSAFSDVALSIGGHFTKYFEQCIAAVNQASMVAAAAVASDDFDEIDERNELRGGCIDAYTGILSALKSAEASQVGLIKQYVPHIVGFLGQLIQDKNLYEDDSDSPPMQGVLGLVGDLVGTFQAQMREVIQQDFCEVLIARGMGKAKTKKYARWCKKELGKIGINIASS